MKYISTVVILLALMGLGAIIYAWSGVYNIAATAPHRGITSSFIEILRDRSIAARSDDIQAPDPDDSKAREAGFPHYHGMCRLCHGAPGFQREEFAEGLYPSPPSMTSGHIQEKRSPTEIYWIVEHGIKLTGMPAFGPTHSEEELWDIVAFAENVPRMDPEQYRRMARMENETGHRHSRGEEGEEKDPGHGQSAPSAHEAAEEERQ